MRDILIKVFKIRLSILLFII